MDWIHDLPSWLVAVVMVALFSGGAVGGLALSRGWSRRRGLNALVDNGVIGWIFSAILGIYAIAIGLIAVASWNNASEASTAASQEAAEVAALFRDVQGYPEPVQTHLEQAFIHYVKGVVGEDWPAQCRGLVPRRGTKALDDIADILYPFAPENVSHQIVHAETLRAFNTLVHLRRLRLEAVVYPVPGPLWGVVLSGALISILASYVFSMDSFWIHATMTGLL